MKGRAGLRDEGALVDNEGVLRLFSSLDKVKFKAPISSSSSNSSWSQAVGPFDRMVPLLILYPASGYFMAGTVSPQFVLSLSTSRQRSSSWSQLHHIERKWLLALPISSCGLRLDDEAVRVAVGVRLGLNICEPNTGRCGTL